MQHPGVSGGPATAHCLESPQLCPILKACPEPVVEASSLSSAYNTGVFAPTLPLGKWILNTLARDRVW